VIADGSEVRVNKVNFSSIPGIQYTPLIVGIIVSAVILIIAAILASIPKGPELKVSFQDKSRESLEAGRRMLKESIADVERLRKSGEGPATRIWRGSNVYVAIGQIMKLHSRQQASRSKSGPSNARTAVVRSNSA